MLSIDNHGATTTESVMDGLKGKLRDLLALIPSGSSIALIDEPVHRNIGDHLIQIASESFFREYNIRILYRANVWNYRASHCRDFLEVDTIIVFQGGGHLGDLYPHHQDLRERVLHDFPDHKAVILPQSIYFQSASRLRQAQAAFGAHKHLHICLRDQTSWQFAKEHFSSPIHLLPDMTHHLWPMTITKPTMSDAPGLFLIRGDKEGSAVPAAVEPYRPHFTDWNRVITYRDKLVLTGCVVGFLLGKRHHGFSLHADRVVQRLRHNLVRKAVSLFSAHENIVSSRLHGVLLGLLLGKEVTALPSVTGKTTAYFANWLYKMPAVRLDDKTSRHCKEQSDDTRVAKLEPSVTVVVTVYNDEEHIAACIDSLLSQNYGNYRILIVDDGSKDGTRAIVQRRFSQVRLISLETNQGVPAARNTGIRNADTEIIAFIDADARAPSHWLSKLIAPFSDKNIGASGGPDAAPPEDSDFGQSVDFTMRSWLATGHLRKSSPLAKFSLTGCNMAVRSAIFAEIGLFNERLRHRGEEKELSQRIRRHGHKMVYVPEGEILHHRRDAYSSFWRQNYLSGRARYEILAAAPDALEPAHMFPAGLILLLGTSLPASLAMEFLLLVPAGYLLLLILNGVMGGFQQRNWKAVLRVAVLTAFIHFGYGSGLIIRTFQAVFLRRHLRPAQARH